MPVLLPGGRPMRFLGGATSPWPAAEAGSALVLRRLLLRFTIVKLLALFLLPNGLPIFFLGGTGPSGRLAAESSSSLARLGARSVGLLSVPRSCRSWVAASPPTAAALSAAPGHLPRRFLGPAALAGPASGGGAWLYSASLPSCQSLALASLAFMFSSSPS